MDRETTIDLLALIRGLNDRGVRFLVIGGQAVRLYGCPIFTHDTDLWIDAAARREVLRWLEGELGLDLSDGPDGQRPIVSATATIGRVDAFFVRSMTNAEGTRIEFEQAFARARVMEDPEGARVLVPEIDDLIALKKMRVPHARDEEHIRHLLVRRSLEERGEV